MSLCFPGAKEYHLHLAVEATNAVCEKFYFTFVSLATWGSLHIMQLFFIGYIFYVQLPCVSFHNKRSPGSSRKSCNSSWQIGLYFLREC